MRQLLIILTFFVPMLAMASIKWVPAGDLDAGQVLKTSDRQIIRVVSVKRKLGTKPMYNLTISQNHDFFISDLGNGVLVHNVCEEFVSQLMLTGQQTKILPNDDVEALLDMGETKTNIANQHKKFYGFTVRGDTRSLEEIRQAGGFKKRLSIGESGSSSRQNTYGAFSHHTGKWGISSSRSIEYSSRYSNRLYLIDDRINGAYDILEYRNSLGHFDSEMITMREINHDFDIPFEAIMAYKGPDTDGWMYLDSYIPQTKEDPIYDDLPYFSNNQSGIYGRY